jgi:uncharacterized protein
MTQFSRSLVAVLALVTLMAATPVSLAGEDGKPHPADEALVGTWMGDMNGARIYYRIWRGWDGRLVASTGCIEAVQSALLVDAVVLTGRKVKITRQRVKLSYDGTLMASGRSIEGTLRVGPRKRPVTLEKVDSVPGPTRPQTPRGLFPYEERRVHYRNEAAGIVLAGTLTLPRQGGPFPAVLLIPGSGPADRNEEIAFHRPFEVIADYLARRGIAVLRVDKRGVAESQGDYTKSSISDFMSDALAGVKFLAGLPRIDAKRIGLVGHSEGGAVAPVAATESTDVSFAVLLAGPAISEFDIMVMQDGTEAMAAGASEEQAALIRAWSARYYAIVRDAVDLAEARKKLEALKAARTPEERQAYKFLGDVGSLNIDIALDKGFREDLKADYSQYLSKMKCPVLALFGQKDCQVPSAPDAKAAREAFTKGGNKDAKVMELPALNHMFQKCSTGATAEYATIEQTVSPDALKIMGDWIEAHTKKQQ